MAEVAPYMLKADLGAVNSKTVTVNSRYWVSLPEEVRNVMQEVAIIYRDHVANIAMNRAQESLDGYVKAGGTIIEMSAADRKAWADSMPDIAAEWATQLDDVGEPGSIMLRSYLDKLKADGQVPVRDWTAGLK